MMAGEAVFFPWRSFNVFSLELPLQVAGCAMIVLLFALGI